MKEMMFPMPEQMDRVSRAFGNQSLIFDDKVEANEITSWLRGRVRGYVLSVLKPGSRILELNAGTGLDAAHFGEHGHFVYATDISEGMVSKIQDKIDSGARIVKAEKRSYTDLGSLPAASFDCIFSNFGGLNCVPDLEPVITQFSRLLKPGGLVILVVMPKICPWEIMSFLKGRFRQSVRRLKPNGTYSHLEGEYFTTWYHSPSHLKSLFGKKYTFQKLEGLASLVPAPYRETFPTKYPGLFSQLCRWEEKVARRWPFNRMCDHYMLTMKLND
jgi:ubiquinone/menaquinone biosynthesis C-methylase UbiE